MLAFWQELKVRQTSGKALVEKREVFRCFLIGGQRKLGVAGEKPGIPG